MKNAKNRYFYCPSLFGPSTNFMLGSPQNSTNKWHRCRKHPLWTINHGLNGYFNAYRTRYGLKPLKKQAISRDIYISFILNNLYFTIQPLCHIFLSLFIYYHIDIVKYSSKHSNWKLSFKQTNLKWLILYKI